jgi:hypothetical protein
MRSLLALVVVVALAVARPAAAGAADVGLAAKKKAKPCAKLHGKKRKACLKRQRAKRRQQQQQQQGAQGGGGGSTPALPPAPGPGPGPGPAPAGPSGPQLSRDDSGARAQLAFTKLTLAQETSTGLNQYCISFGDSQYRATYDYSSGLTGGQSAEGGGWQVTEGYAVANAPFQWAVKVQAATSKGGEVFEVDIAGGQAEVVTGDGSVFQRGVNSRETNASSYC